MQKCDFLNLGVVQKRNFLAESMLQKRNFSDWIILQKRNIFAEILVKQGMEEVDRVKREIVNLYYDDFKKVDASGRLSDIYRSVPSQLALKKRGL